MSRSVSLSSCFRSRGSWYVDGVPTPIGGEIRVCRGRVSLHLDAIPPTANSGWSAPNSTKRHLVTGVAAGRRFTCAHCFLLRTRVGSNGSACILRSQLTVTHQGEEPLEVTSRFKRIRVRCSGLADWVGLDRLRRGAFFDGLRGDPLPQGIVLPESDDVLSEHDGVGRVTFVGSVSAGINHRLRRISMKERWHVALEPPTECDPASALAAAVDFVDLLGLLFGSRRRLIAIDLENDEKMFRHASVLTRLTPDPPRKGGRLEVPAIPRTQLNQSVAEIFAAWCELRRGPTSAAIDSYLGAQKRPSRWAETKFLEQCLGFESLHRALSPPHPDREDQKQLIATIRAAVPADVDPATRQRVLSLLSMLNDIPLRARIGSTAHELRDIIPAQPNETLDEFAKGAAESRSSLAHGGRTARARRATPLRLLYWSFRLECMSYVMLLLRLGFPRELVQKAVRVSARLEQLEVVSQQL